MFKYNRQNIIYPLQPTKHNFPTGIQVQKKMHTIHLIPNNMGAKGILYQVEILFHQVSRQLLIHATDRLGHLSPV